MDEKRKKKHLKRIEESKSKIPLLDRLKRNQIVKERATNIIEEADKVYIPEKAREKAKEGEEAVGKTRIYEAEKEGEKIAIVIPRFKEKYKFLGETLNTFSHEKGATKSPLNLTKDRQFHSEKKAKKAIEEGEMGEAHTHPEGKAEHSKADKMTVSSTKTPSLVINKEEAEIAYRKKEGLKQKKAKYIDTDELKNLMKKDIEKVEQKEAEYISKDKLRDLMEKDIVKKRTKRRKKPVLKRKEKEEKKEE